ncbi:STAS-like domain-containing protein [Flavobacterium algoritolerans]|uniref:STAS-like domain-containing protein n=1 Tax=Flavobacterium algoritolerans TaxID=3041254 RepID=A0ABT6VAB8_9FLAO|nr:STAS-like domain-containing protein [Flavobacterium algoritolerans]MDI5894139.1 STAS-like domain-containing protein [Flavobacterium algoritolerans]
MNNTTQISVKNIVSNTETNVEGIKLYCVLDKSLKEKHIITLEIENDMQLTSSFLNSSLGNIIDNYGFNILKSNLKLKCSKAQYNRLSSYLYKYNDIYQK